MQSQDKSKSRIRAKQQIKEQTHFIKKITDISPDILSIVELHSRKILYSNRDMMVSLGFDADEIKKMNYSSRVKLFHPDDLVYIQAYYDRFLSLKDNEENRVEYRIKNRKGKWVFLSVRGRVFQRDKKGNVVEVLMVGHDITENKKAEQEVLKLKDEIAKRAEDKYYSLFKNIDEGVAILELIRDEHGQIIDFIYKEVNEAFYRHAGRGADFVGKKRSELGPKTEPQFFAALQSVIDTGIPFRGENFSENYNRWITFQYSLVGAKGSEFLAAVFTDITERKIAEDALQKASKQKDNFMGIVSHELKTPVTSLKVFAQYLESKFSKNEDRENAQILTKMIGQIDKLTTLIADLLDTAKIESGKLAFREQTFSFDTLLAEIIDEVQRTSASHKIIHNGLTKQEVYADRDRIGQVITNLLTNAIKYSPLAEDVIVSAKAFDHHISVRVRDFGIGIGKDKQQKIFERFYREDGEDQSTYPGFGIGLYVAAEIIKRYDGKIGVKSGKGKGSTFYFTLPVERE